jgi:ABC-type nitrate/sulfonate/bicarbonate transport system permease component
MPALERWQWKTSRLPGVALVVALLVISEGASRGGLVSAHIVPPVTTIIERGATLFSSGILPWSYAQTLLRVAQGYGYAVIFGVGLGILMGSFPMMHRALITLIELLRPLPSAAIIPVVMLFLGLGDGMKVFIIAWASFFPILLNTMSGVRNIDPTLLETARTFRFSTRQALVKFILPGASPQIATGMRMSLSLALILGVTTELVAGENGIGFFILQAERRFRAAEMYAGVVTLGVVGYALNWAFLKIEGWALAWHRLTIQETLH